MNYSREHTVAEGLAYTTVWNMVSLPLSISFSERRLIPPFYSLCSKRKISPRRSLRTALSLSLSLGDMTADTAEIDSQRRNLLLSASWDRNFEVELSNRHLCWYSSRLFSFDTMLAYFELRRVGGKSDFHELASKSKMRSSWTKKYFSQEELGQCNLPIESRG